MFKRRKPVAAAEPVPLGRPIASGAQLRQHVLAEAEASQRSSPHHQVATPAPQPQGGFSVRVIALYAPAIAWEAVASTRPQYVGHAQPHLPSTLGFGDQRSPHGLREEAALAKRFGVHAFGFICSDLTQADASAGALANLLADPSVEMSFCCVWRVDSPRSPQAALALDGVTSAAGFFGRCFDDPRHVHVHGRPLLVIDGLGEWSLDESKQLVDRMRTEAHRLGHPGLYVVWADAQTDNDILELGVDALMEMPPRQMNAVDLTHKVDWFNPGHSGCVHDYLEAALRFGCEPRTGPRCFKTVMPGWDSEPACAGHGTSFKGNTPHAFAQWLRTAAKATLRHPEAERFMFVNAWNDWMHGAHLQPDLRHGHAFLNALSETLAELDDTATLESFAETVNSRFRRGHDVAIFAHFFYEDVLHDLFDAYLKPLAGLADLHVSVTENMSISALARLNAAFPNMRIHVCENRGRDVKPFIEMYRKASGDGYAIGFKLHGKRSPHLAHGALWRQQLIDPLFGSRAVFEQHVSKLSGNDKTALLVPRSALHRLNEAGLNQRWLDELLCRTGHAHRVGRYRWQFAAGTMFGFRFNALAALLNEQSISLALFEPEAGQLDGTYAHALERMLGLFATEQGRKIAIC